MSIPEKDNRIQFPPTPVDFDNTVGVADQAHDTYPIGGQQPRFDWMRSVIIGLLSQQSSTQPPTQFRTGTPWFNKTTKLISIWSGTAWEPLSKYIDIGGINLFDFYDAIRDKIDSINPISTFSGRCAAVKSVSIKVPDSINSSICELNNMRALVYKNGLLIDPRKSILSGSCPLFISLDQTEALHQGDVFTVVIQPIENFVNDEVVVVS